MQNTRCRPRVFAAIEVHRMMQALQGGVQNDRRLRFLVRADAEYFRRVVVDPDARVVARALLHPPERRACQYCQL
jgi:hypothetical protein